MSYTKDYIEKLFTGNNITLNHKNKEIFEKFIIEEIIQSVELISNQQKSIMENWRIRESKGQSYCTEGRAAGQQ
jgi:hypothetical protein